MTARGPRRPAAVPPRGTARPTGPSTPAVPPGAVPPAPAPEVRA